MTVINDIVRPIGKSAIVAAMTVYAAAGVLAAESTSAQHPTDQLVATINAAYENAGKATRVTVDGSVLVFWLENATDNLVDLLNSLVGDGAEKGVYCGIVVDLLDESTRSTVKEAGITDVKVAQIEVLCEI